MSTVSIRSRRSRRALDPVARGIVSESARHTRRGRIGIALAVIPLIVMAIVNIFPIYWIFISAFRTLKDLLAYPPIFFPSHLTVANLNQAWNALDFARYFANTAVVVGGTVVLRVTASALAAYALSRLALPFKKILFGAVLGLLMLPSVAYFVPLYVAITNVPLLHLNLINTFWALWLPGVGSPVLILLFKNFFDQMPDSLFEAAKVDGAGEVRTFLRIALPLARPVIGVGILVTAISAWQDFLMPLLTLPDQRLWTLEIALYHMNSGATPLPLQLAAMAIATFPMIIIFLIFQKHIMKGVVVADKG